MNVQVLSIPHSAHRYGGTVGDWFDWDGQKQIRVSKMDPRYEVLVALHEFIESYLCDFRGISESDVTAFDKYYEHERDLGIHKSGDEPGDDLRAPYGAEHKFATRLEQMMAEELGVNWEEYSKALEDL